jgi:hypothetical protein
MNIHDIYARISMPVPPSGRVPQAFICDAIYVVFSEHRWDPKGRVSKLQNLERQVVGSSNLVGRWGRPSTARRPTDRTQFIWGDVSNHRLYDGWSWEVQIRWAGGGDCLQHGARRIGPNLFGGCV